MKTPQQQQNNDSSNSIAENTGEGAVSYAPPNPFGGERVMQREIIEYKNAKDEHEASVSGFITNLNLAVEKAYNHVYSVPRLGDAPKKIDGHTAKWEKDWAKYMQSEDVLPTTLNTSFGYVIETLSTRLYGPSAPAGLHLELQGIRGSTRPDVILHEKKGDVLWLDITASKSAGHIFEKAGKWNEKPYVSEITYPSVEFKDFSAMRKRDGEKEFKEFKPEELKKQLEEAEALHRLRLEHWRKSGVKLKKNLKKGGSSINELIQYPVLNALISIYKLDIEKYNVSCPSISNEQKDFINEAPNILAALRLNPKTYRFTSGGEQRGQSWLMVHDASTPQSTDKEEPKRATALFDEMFSLFSAPKTDTIEEYAPESEEDEESASASPMASASSSSSHSDLSEKKGPKRKYSAMEETPDSSSSVMASAASGHKGKKHKSVKSKYAGTSKSGHYLGAPSSSKKKKGKISSSSATSYGDTITLSDDKDLLNESGAGAEDKSYTDDLDIGDD